eukprot:g3728.t1
MVRGHYLQGSKKKKAMQPAVGNERASRDAITGNPLEAWKVERKEEEQNEIAKAEAYMAAHQHKARHPRRHQPPRDAPSEISHQSARFASHKARATVIEDANTAANEGSGPSDDTGATTGEQEDEIPSDLELESAAPLQLNDEEKDPCTGAAIADGKDVFGAVACKITGFFQGAGHDETQKTAKKIVKLIKSAAKENPDKDPMATVVEKLGKIEKYVQSQLEPKLEEGARSLQLVLDALSEAKSLASKSSDGSIGPEQIIPFLEKAKTIVSKPEFDSVISKASSKAKAATALRVHLAAVKHAIEWATSAGDSVSPKTIEQVLADVNATKITYEEAKVHLQASMEHAQDASKKLEALLANVTGGMDIGLVSPHVVSEASESQNAASSFQNYVQLIRLHLSKHCKLAEKLGTRKDPAFTLPKVCEEVKDTDALAGYVADDGSSDPDIVKAYQDAVDKSIDAISSSSSETDTAAGENATGPVISPFPVDKLKELEPEDAVSSQLKELTDKVAALEKALDDGNSDLEAAATGAATGGEGDVEEEVEEEEEIEPAATGGEKEKKVTKKKEKDSKDGDWEHPTIVPEGHLDGPCGCSTEPEPADCSCDGKKKDSDNDSNEDDGAPSKPLFLDPNPCPACGDGELNCGEVEIDCGGPCAACAPPPVTTIPEGSSVIDALWVGQSVGERVQQLKKLGKEYRPEGGATSLRYSRKDPGKSKVELHVTIPVKSGHGK